MKNKLADKKNKIEKILKEIIEKPDNNYEKKIYDVMNYSINSGGKRIRPILMNEVYEMYSNKEDDSIKYFIAAIEMIHTYSLIHDDLPCMDDDDYRRGKLTSHKKFNEWLAVLGGDALLNMSFETALKSVEYNKNAIKSMKLLYKLAGPKGMISGQVIDLYTENKKIDKETLKYIHENKTGKLIKASVLIGAMLADVDEDEILLLEKYSEIIGLIFQIKDDILDVEGEFEKLGKPINSDDKNSKMTFVTLYGLEESKKILKEYTDEALVILKKLKKQNEFLKELTIYIANREK